jgi:DNA repair protein RadD
MSYQLRDYQQQTVQAVLHYFRRHSDPAVVVLPTGAGKSLVIAELARLAKGRVLVLAHVKELVEQNHSKYQQYGLNAGIYAAGLGRKESQDKVVFASIQSVARNLDAFAASFSLLVIDECHRVPQGSSANADGNTDENSSYRQVIRHLQQQNPGIKILGLTATPYRLGQGFIYQYHSRGLVRSEDARFFRFCIFELPIRYLLDQQYLTPAKVLDAPLLSYDFSGLKPTSAGYFREEDLAAVINSAKRVTPQIISQVQHYAQQRQGVMIFAATSAHAREILSYLPDGEAALILASTKASDRMQLIQAFKQRQLKYLVNVAVLTTGFDAPHVDLIAILRPTESVSLYQQIVGRGLRLSPDKTDCLVLDYAGNMYDLYSPEVGSTAPSTDSELVTIPCPLCQFANTFWGKTDPNGFIIEHYGRKCQGFDRSDLTNIVACGYRFRAKFCPDCGEEHDIAAKFCHACQTVLVDPDKKLQDAMKLKDALILYPQRMELEAQTDSKGQSRLKVSYLGEDGQQLHEFWALHSKAQKQRFAKLFLPPHLPDRHRPYDISSTRVIVSQSHRLVPPAALVARKDGRFWRIRDKLFGISQMKSN